MIEHAGVKRIIALPENRHSVSAACATFLTPADLLDATVGQRPMVIPLPTRQATDLAYVLYTSGSTGQPKGVMVTHRALNNLLSAFRNLFPELGVGNRVLAHTTLSFDIAQLELWLPLLSGSAVILAERHSLQNAHHLADLVESTKVDFMQATPTWSVLVETGWSPKRSITALSGGGHCFPN